MYNLLVFLEAVSDWPLLCLADTVLMTGLISLAGPDSLHGHLVVHPFLQTVMNSYFNWPTEPSARNTRHIRFFTASVSVVQEDVLLGLRSVEGDFTPLLPLLGPLLELCSWKTAKE